jgi:Leucine-rich repeat (LRR) protein
LELTVRSNELKVIPVEICNLKNLKILYLDGNRLISVPAEIGNLKNLNLINFENNNITYLPSEISNLNKLEWLYLGGNNFSESEKQKIHQLLPNCKIYWEKLDYGQR